MFVIAFVVISVWVSALSVCNCTAWRISNLLAHFADFQLHVDAADDVRADDDTGLLGGSEPACGYSQVVCAGQEVQERVAALAIRFDSGLLRRPLVDDGNIRAGYTAPDGSSTVPVTEPYSTCESAER